MYMAKSKSRKKRKYTKHIPTYISNRIPKEPVEIPKTDSVNLVGMDKTASEVNKLQECYEPRASENAYVFVLGCKTFIRNLPDQNLVDEIERIRLELYEARRVVEKLEGLNFNLNKEQYHRGL